MKKHYTPPYGYGAYTPKKVVNSSYGNNLANVDGEWIPARPEPYYSLKERLIQAWHVLTYKADALYWGRTKE